VVGNKLFNTEVAKRRRSRRGIIDVENKLNKFQIPEKIGRRCGWNRSFVAGIIRPRAIMEKIEREGGSVL